MVRHNETPRRTKAAPKKFNQVFDHANRRVRGLWVRNGVYYSQVRAGKWRGRVALEHAQSVPEATTAAQVLKSVENDQVKAVFERLQCRGHGFLWFDGLMKIRSAGIHAPLGQSRFNLLFGQYPEQWPGFLSLLEGRHFLDDDAGD